MKRRPGPRSKKRWKKAKWPTHGELMVLMTFAANRRSLLSAVEIIRLMAEPPVNYTMSTDAVYTVLNRMIYKTLLDRPVAKQYHMTHIGYLSIQAYYVLQEMPTDAILNETDFDDAVYDDADMLAQLLDELSVAEAAQVDDADPLEVVNEPDEVAEPDPLMWSWVE